MLRIYSCAGAFVSAIFVIAGLAVLTIGGSGRALAQEVPLRCESYRTSFLAIAGNSFQAARSREILTECLEGVEYAVRQNRSRPGPGSYPGAVWSAELKVSNTANIRERTPFSTQKGAKYILSVSGFFSDWGDKYEGVDAVWCYASWRCGNGQVWDQLRINGKGMTEIAGKPIPYNPTHFYDVVVEGTGEPFEFYLSDAQGSAGDNSGWVKVVVHRIQ